MIEEPFWLGIDRVFPGVIEVLGAMKSCGAWLHLLTARSRPEWLFSQLRSLGLTEFVDKVTVVSPREAVEAKAAYLRESKPIAFFGDTETDFKSAGAACVPFFAVTTGQRSRQFLNGKEVPQVFDSLLEAWITAKDTCSSNSKAI
jgi:phosphoglycolate phosphatase-like HAD superfamily hydrolase